MLSSNYVLFLRAVWVLPFVGFALLTGIAAQAETPQVKWEELTGADFASAIQKSQGVCLLPFGILEKHGPHLPLGTDLINVRYVSLHAAEREFAIVFPEYYFGQIFEARHEPGTIAYPAHLQMELLQATTDEMARNGCKKILIVNGHGGNSSFLPYFAQSQLASPHDYVVYVLDRGDYPPGRPALKTKTDMHAGESETSHTMIARPTWCIWIARAANPERTSNGWIFRATSIRESGGTRDSQITMRETQPRRTRRWDNSIWTPGGIESPMRFAPSSPIRRACNCRTSSSNSRGIP